MTNLEMSLIFILSKYQAFAWITNAYPKYLLPGLKPVLPAQPSNEGRLIPVGANQAPRHDPHHWLQQYMEC